VVGGLLLTFVSSLVAFRGWPSLREAHLSSPVELAEVDATARRGAEPVVLGGRRLTTARAPHPQRKARLAGVRAVSRRGVAPKARARVRLRGTGRGTIPVAAAPSGPGRPSGPAPAPTSEAPVVTPPPVRPPPVERPPAPPAPPPPAPVQQVVDEVTEAVGEVVPPPIRDTVGTVPVVDDLLDGVGL
jgi:hypothetical protein